MKRLFATLLSIVVLSLIAAQCGAAPETITVVETVVVKEEVEVIKEVEVEVITEVETIVEIEAPDVPKGELIVSVSTFPNSIYILIVAERNASNVANQRFEG